MKNADVIQVQNSSGVVQLQQSQILDAATVAAKAFVDDPVFTYVISDDREFRLQSLTWLMRNVVAYSTRYNHVYTPQYL